MSGSYSKINYSLRPAKCIERKMILDAARHLHPFGAIKSYRYVGFGSPYFADFILFHNQLGMERMISIESDVESRARFEHNKPFRCIEIVFGHSNHVLPNLDWGPRSIYWLDYDGRLDQSILLDVQTVVTHASAGSLILFTVGCDPKSEGKRLDSLRSKVGKKYLPRGLADSDMAGWGTARACREVIDNKIREVLVDRNVGQHALRYRQLFNFHYADNCMMLCVGGILYDDGQEGQLAACQFDKLEYMRDGAQAFHILVPKLTRLELRYLNTFLPWSDCPDESRGIPKDQVDSYRQVYRYFPVYSEVDI